MCERTDRAAAAATSKGPPVTDPFAFPELVPGTAFPRVLLFQKYLPIVAMPVPAGLSADEVLRRVEFLVRQRLLLAFVVWSETRMTTVAPFGPAREEAPSPDMLRAHRMLQEVLPPVPDPGDLTRWPLHLQARRSLTGRWGVTYPDGLSGWTSPEDSTLHLRDDGTYTWSNPLPWFTDGRLWQVSGGGVPLVLALGTRYHWDDHHLLIPDTQADGRHAWIWRTRGGRDILRAVDAGESD